MEKYRLKIGDQILNVELEKIGSSPEIPDNSTPVKAGFVGACAHPWNPLDKLKGFNIRLYIDAAWIWTAKGLYINPMKQAKAQTAFGMLDEYFNEAAKLGVDVAPCVLRCPDWLNGYSENNGTNSNDYPPIRKGADRLDPKSYEEYAGFWEQLAMRYGTRTFPDNKLKIDTTPRWTNDIPNVKKSGLGALDLDKGGVRIKYFEIGNEVMKWWNRGTDKEGTYMNAKEFATMLLVVYRAIRKVSDIGVIMGGTTGFELPYIKEMFAHIEKIAPGEKFTDKIVIHNYSNLFNERDKWPPTWRDSAACMPSEDKAFPAINDIVSFAKSRGMEVWVNEFGCDSEPPSWMHINGSRYGLSDQDAQAKQIVESFKAYAAAGVERAYMFMFADEQGGPGLWQRCGLVAGENKGYAEKPAYQAVKKLIQA
jgi:hypothetical protein